MVNQSLIKKFKILARFFVCCDIFSDHNESKTTQILTD